MKVQESTVLNSSITDYLRIKKRERKNSSTSNDDSESDMNYSTTIINDDSDSYSTTIINSSDSNNNFSSMVVNTGNYSTTVNKSSDDNDKSPSYLAAIQANQRGNENTLQPPNELLLLRLEFNEFKQQVNQQFRIQRYFIHIPLLLTIGVLISIYFLNNNQEQVVPQPDESFIDFFKNILS